MKLSVANDFSRTPGSRRIAEGPFSGEAFRKEVLLPAIREAIALGEPLTVDLDGTAGMSTGFLEESFGGLVRLEGLSRDRVLASLQILCSEEPYLVSEVLSYIADAVPQKETRR